MTPKPTPRQELSLLPGIYYHPEARLEEGYWTDDHLTSRGHWLLGYQHGIWENYYWSDGSLMRRRHYLHGEKHGLEENYHPDGTLKKLQFFYKDARMPFFIGDLLGESTLKLFT
jgi:antitoxin component YwqK of YwqJK toxin-antitoxin module